MLAHKEACAVTRSAVRLAVIILAFIPLTLRAQDKSQPAGDAKALVYADFEKIENNRPVSARGGAIQLFAYEESGVHKSTFKGLEGRSSCGSRRMIRTMR